MKLYPLALLAGLVPLIAIHLCYMLAVQAGHVPACIPYLNSCTSISSAGREGLEFYFFKALMLPAAVIIFLFWLYTTRWLNLLTNTSKSYRNTIVVLGLIAALGLLWYSVMLGAIGPQYRLQRRWGVIIFFSLSFIAQFMCMRALARPNKFQANLQVGLRLVAAYLLAIVLFAVSAVIISSINSDAYDAIEDTFEWWVTLLLCLFPLTLARLWRKTHFQSNLSLGA